MGMPRPPAPDPRDVAEATLEAMVAGRLATLVAHYGAAARRAEGELRDALEALMAAKRAQRETFLASASGAPSDGAGSVTPDPEAGPPRWGVLLGKAFETERALEQASTQLARLAPPGTPGRAVAARLAGQVALDRATVRRLYLRYS